MQRNDFERDFRTDETWRIFRIMSEFVEGTEELAKVTPAVSIFGSARIQETDPYYALGVKIAKGLADEGFNIITGGGPGIMEAANRGAKESSVGKSIGLNIELPFEQHANPYLNQSLSFRYFFVRKVMFLKYASAVVVLPGGFGTLDELFESLTLVQTEKIPAIPVFLMGTTFWSGLIDWIKERLIGDKLISADDLNLFTVTDDTDHVIQSIIQSARLQGLYQPPLPHNLGNGM